MAVAASIDIGTNTLRLLAAEVKGGRIVREVLNLRANTRLGQGLSEGGRLLPEARKRTLDALNEFAEKLDEHGVKNVSAVATEALRRALDADDFIGEALQKTGIQIEVISGEQEAERTLAGVRAGVSGTAGPGEKLVIDIGGGSTEFIITPDWKKFTAKSVPLGAVSLFERFLPTDPPRDREIAELTSHCFVELRKLAGFLPERAGELIGTAGTITTLAAVEMGMEEYDPLKVTGHRITLERLDTLIGRFCGLTGEQRRLLAGLEPGREDIIVSGSILLRSIMGQIKADFITVCDYGLREGNLLYHAGRRHG